MNDIIQYFIGAVCPVFDGVMPDWKTHIEIVCVYGSAVCLMALVTLYTVLQLVSCFKRIKAHYLTPPET